jgi:ferredoxin
LERKIGRKKVEPKSQEPEVEPKKVDEPEVEPKKAKVEKLLYEEVMWKGVKKVYRCIECGWCEDEKDDMVLHVLYHFPVLERDKILERMVK